MGRRFNVTGVCRPQLHYMVNLDSRLRQIQALVDAGEYFSINRARQYGKTTILYAMARYLRKEYVVFSMDFQMLSAVDFATEASFVAAFVRELLAGMARENDIFREMIGKLETILQGDEKSQRLGILFSCLSEFCAISKEPVVLMIDEVDTASNNQVFLDFLSQLRGYFNHRQERPIFQSVILAGVYDIRNLKRKIRQDSEHRLNSPWNIAAQFDVDMSFHTEDIAGMLAEYEADHHTGMDIPYMAGLL